MTLNEFKEKWLTNFASGISQNDIEKYVVSTGNLLWHVFSWELLPEKTYLAGKDAKKAYNKIDKRGAVYLLPFKDDYCKDITFDLNTASDLDKYVEIYVVAKDFSWTYIKTHEDMCGPYFCKK